MSGSEHSNSVFIPGEGDPEPAGTAVWGLVGAVLIFVTVVWIQAMFYHQRDEEYVLKTYGQPYQPLVDLRAEQMRANTGYRWIDRNTGTVGIPVERAMDLVQREAKVELETRHSAPVSTGASGAAHPAMSGGAPSHGSH